MKMQKIAQKKKIDRRLWSQRQQGENTENDDDTWVHSTFQIDVRLLAYFKGSTQTHSFPSTTKCLLTLYNVGNCISYMFLNSNNTDM